tara:strand:- start:31 stop:219 length:189 start_codon:yes stop_codon:yes gene_type:complete
MDKTDEQIASNDPVSDDKEASTDEWNPTSRIFRRAAKKGITNPSFPAARREGNHRSGGKKKN